ncbi:hypothetical protein A2867_05095 [Candidatus Daviesbacteria bacterium RIFCSPHIGHO2_01_FULL_40_11]|uniref:PAS domain-containing protein n=1 Tax=Candidatus Daviesbacteria bacterium RIFCSPHIGHO2_01_FULL_40_11 TaxID=1797762 RepID=A0A1F5JF28_9BACT|nr:MAG: hypothetical protein A2867_05095 [Candidatus Daviesbacteria bacterium RIFCSPHIGHO2_01_FULL_40_11]
MFSFESIIFLLSSAFSLALIYYKASTTNLQQIIIILLVILILSYRFIFSKSKPALARWFRPILLLLTAAMVQLIVISTGGFFSPFLIMLHLFTLGTSFLLNLPASISFLGLSLIVLTVNIWLNQTLLALSQEDPFSIVLYFISFIVIIPLAQIINHSYHIKDALSKILSENLYLGQRREESIIKGLNELILVTDKNLKILSINQAVEEVINLTSDEILGHSLLEILPIKFKDGSQATMQNLSISQILQDKTTRIISDFYLDRPGKVPTQITIQVRPIADFTGKINQFVFVLKERQLEGMYSAIHKDLDLAYRREQLVFGELQKALAQTRVNSLQLRAEILRKIAEDLLIAQEIEDHPIIENISLSDVAEVCQKALKDSQGFAKSLNVTAEFKLALEETAEVSLLSLKGQKVPEAALSGVSDFGVLIDPKWLEVILEKLLEIAILLASEQKEGRVEILPLRQGDRNINVTVISFHANVPEKVKEDLLTEYFGNLATTTNLRLGSGLEGFIAQTIAKELKVPLSVKVEQRPPSLTFLLELSKDRTIKNTV